MRLEDLLKIDAASIRQNPNSGDHDRNIESLFAETKAQIEPLALSGYSLCINQSMLGYEHFESSYPQEWQDEYARRRYYVGDPVVTWALIHSGDKRWSEIAFPDLRGVMRKAKGHGMGFGAVFCRSSRTKCSFLSISRHDREFTTAEMLLISELTTDFIDLLNEEPELSKGEAAVLRCLSQDMDVKGAAEHLGIAESTAKGRLATARKKFGCKTNYFLVSKFLAEGAKIR